MTLQVSQWLVIALLAVFVAMSVACGSLGGTGAITGEVRFAREVELPKVPLSPSSWQTPPTRTHRLWNSAVTSSKTPSGSPSASASSMTATGVSDRNEYSLSADVRVGDDLLYVNDTVHTVLTRGAPNNNDVVVVSTDHSDKCAEPLPGRIHSGHTDEDMPGGGVLHVRLVDVTDPGEPVVVAEATPAPSRSSLSSRTRASRLAATVDTS